MVVARDFGGCVIKKKFHFLLIGKFRWVNEGADDWTEMRGGGCNAIVGIIGV